MANAFYPYNKNTVAPHISSMKEFRENIIKRLTGPANPSKHVKPQASFHYSSPIPLTKKKKNPARLWKHCSTKLKRWKTRH